MGDCHWGAHTDVLAVEKMNVWDLVDSWPCVAVGRVAGINDVLVRLDGLGKKVNGAKVVEKEVCLVVYVLMAGVKEGHSVSKKAVVRLEAVTEVL